MARKPKTDIESQLEREPEVEPVLDPRDALGSGSTLLNLAMTGRRHGAFYPGKYYGFVGDSDSGKTFLTLTCFAEAVISKKFNHYRLIHDNPEDGKLMDVSKFFGDKTNRRIEPPRGTRAKPIYSTTVEDMYFNIDAAFDAGEPFIYVVDSMDALDTGDDQKKFDERRKASEGRKKAEEEDGTKAKKVKGSYGMSKAKLNSSGLRTVFARLKDSKSIVIFISQTRDNVDPMAMTNKTYSGGKSLKFYAHGQMWTSVAGRITRTVRGIPRDLGIYSKVRVAKNRQTGRKVDLEVPIYWSFGIDDLGSCVDYLIDEKHWKEDKGYITAPEFNDNRTRREDLIQKIMSGGHEEDLRELVEEVWLEVQEEMTIHRKSRYSDG